MPSSSEIRQQFIDFFVQKHGHTFVPSSSVVPLDDPTLLFTNAGMNQFKDVFLGTGTRPYKRAANTQKCIRAGGKHNDLDDVGKDTYHHTFFEMLGNWSFGDYFKREAIQWAWELLTKVWKLDKSRLHATVFEGAPDEGVPRDDEAIEYWKTLTDINHKHIHLGNKKDNFWEMGETGPCGPCTEIHIDLTPDGSGAKLVNKGTPQVIEIWNLVFIQFNRGEDKKLTPLPAKHVDTGMGFERVTAVLQGKTSNYDTDVFGPLMEAIGRLVHKQYKGQLNDLNDIAFRVIADHLRMLTFSINDGALPGNKDRGSVLRSVLRRAFRFGYQCFGLREPFVWKLVPALVDQMGISYPELRNNPKRIQDVIQREEDDFLKTIERGMERFGRAAAEAIATAYAQKRGHQFIRTISRGYFEGEDPSQPLGVNMQYRDESANTYERRVPNDLSQLAMFRKQECKSPQTISAKNLFDLHTTYGFPPDLTRQMAQERGFEVDIEGYEQLMREHEETSRGDRSFQAIVADRLSFSQTAMVGDWTTTDDKEKWDNRPVEHYGEIVAWAEPGGGEVHRTGILPSDRQLLLILDRTCFYAEAGGQISDKGRIKTSYGEFEVEDVVKKGNTVFHVGKVVSGEMRVGNSGKLIVDPDREFIKKNHTATHLLNWALRKVLGPHIDQKGSLVDADKTRFDFSHDNPLKPEEIAEVERLVNEKIYGDLPVTASVMPLADAKKIKGVRAVFGEKYPDPVRVLMIGPTKPEEATPEDSIEFCGGTHLQRTGEAGFFKIVSQELVAKGVRRVIAVTGKGAVQTVQQMASVLDQLASKFNCRPEEVASRIESLQEENKKLQQQVKKGVTGDLRTTADKLFTEAVEVNGAKIITGIMPPAASDLMLQELDRMRQKAGSAIILVGWSEEDKVSLLAGVTDDIVKKGGHAGNLIKAVAPLIGGKGGGKPNMAQGGGKDASKLPEAMVEARKVAAAQLGAS